MVHKREMHNSNRFRDQQNVPFDKRAYNNYNHNIISQSQNISLNTNEIDLNNFLNARHSLQTHLYERPEKDKKRKIPDGDSLRFEGDIEFNNREQVMNKPGFVPGYAGYVPKIKPENLYANTFAKTTKDVHEGQFLSGIDHAIDDKYVSSYTSDFRKKNNGPKVRVLGRASSVDMSGSTRSKYFIIFTKLY